MGVTVGTVSALWRFPVKSMGGEKVDLADCTLQGLLGDRAYALIDSETGKVASAKSVRTFPNILDCHASFVTPPRHGHELPPVRVTLPSGTSVISGSPSTDDAISAFFKRKVSLARTSPADFTIDQYHPDVEGAVPDDQRDKQVEQKLGAAFFAEIGADSPVPAGSFFDLFPLSILTSSTLKRLAELQPQTRFDHRRFRMNVIVEADAPGFVENDWIGRALSIGGAVQLTIAMPDPRCVMTTLSQGELAKDTDVLRALVQHNRIQVGASGKFPCAGVYAVVGAAGTIGIGDTVSLVGA